MQEIDSLITKMVEEKKEPFLLLCFKQIALEEFLLLQNALKGKNFDKLNIILQTPGGDPAMAYRMIRLLKTKTKNLEILVPRFAKSAGTLICLGGNKIKLSSFADLGPLDVQLTTIGKEGQNETKSALEEFQALEQIKENNVKVFDSVMQLLMKRVRGLNLESLMSTANEYVSVTSGKLYNEVDTRKLGEYSRALNIGFQYGLKILTTWGGKKQEDAEFIMDRMVYGYPTHGFVVDHIDGNILNLPIEYSCDDDFLENLSILFIKNNIQEIDKVKLFEYNPSA